jgi:hypothetical protein
MGDRYPRLVPEEIATGHAMTGVVDHRQEIETATSTIDGTETTETETEAGRETGTVTIQDSGMTTAGAEVEVDEGGGSETVISLADATSVGRHRHAADYLLAEALADEVHNVEGTRHHQADGETGTGRAVCRAHHCQRSTTNHA